MRTAKARGPDLPTLGSSLLMMIGERRWLKSPDTGESADISRKAIAQGMPDRFGVPVVTNACAFYHCARGYGCIQRPAFPAPSDFRGTRSMHHSDAKRAAGMRSHISLTVIARSVSNDVSAEARRAKAEAIQTAAAEAFWIASLRSQ